MGYVLIIKDLKTKNNEITDKYLDIVKEKT